MEHSVAEGVYSAVGAVVTVCVIRVMAMILSRNCAVRMDD